MDKKTLAKLCKTCGKEFLAQSPSDWKVRKNCSKQCASESYKSRVEIVCLNCNKHFFVWTCQKSQTKFCCQACYFDYIRNYGVLSKVRRKEKIKISCLTCKKEFFIDNYRKDEALFCSKKCCDDFSRERIVCRHCYKEFTAPKFEKRKFCSQKCASTYERTLNTSKWETAIYNTLKNNFPLLDCRHYIYYSPKGFFVTDIRLENKVIECYGDWWHCNPSIFTEDYYHKKLFMTAKQKWAHDKKRQTIIEQQGFEFLVIWEHDYEHNKQEVINKCIQFLQKK